MRLIVDIMLHRYLSLAPDSEMVMIVDARLEVQNSCLQFDEFRRVRIALEATPGPDAAKMREQFLATRKVVYQHNLLAGRARDARRGTHVCEVRDPHGVLAKFNLTLRDLFTNTNTFDDESLRLPAAHP